MKNKYKWIIRLFALSISIVCGFAHSSSVPNIDKEISIIAREQPIESFLKELFGQISIPIIIDESVSGTVNGSFEHETAEQIFNGLSRSFGLVKYYDGAVLYIYSSNDIIRRIMPASNTISKRIVNAAFNMDLVDARNSIKKAVDGGLVVTGTKRFIEQIDELVYAAESGMKDYEPPVGFKVFYLKYAWAQDVTMTFAGRQVVIPGVATILKQLLEDDPRTAYTDGSSEKLLSPTLQGLKGKGLNSIGGANERIGLPDNRVATEVNAQYTKYSSADNHVYQDTSRKKQQIRIEADPRLNAIIIRDSPDKISRYKHLIASLDIEPQMLEIEATIIDVNTDKLRELGFNWRWQHDGDQVLFGNGNKASDIALNPLGPITPYGKGGYISFVLGDQAKFIGRINALEDNDAVNIVSRPHIITLSNVEAIFDTSSTFYVRVGGREEVDLFNVSVGTSLRVTPHVFKDDGVARIKLLVTIEDGSQDKDAMPVDNIPVVNRSAINTQALISAGESVLIGGLVREVKREGESQVPLLGDIPILGNLFKSTSNQKMRVERMFLITPKLSVRKMDGNNKMSSLESGDFNIDNKKQDLKKENHERQGVSEEMTNDNSEKKVNADNSTENWKKLLEM
jgi:type III secretion protein C